MKVQMTYSVDLQEVLKTLAVRLDQTKHNVDEIPRLLGLSSQLLSEQDSAISFSALKLVQKAKEKLDDINSDLVEIENMLSGYVNFVVSSDKEDTEEVDMTEDTAESLNVWDPESKTYKSRENAPEPE